MTDHHSRRFPTTAWTALQLAQEKDAEDVVGVHDDFIANYWKPVFYFLRAKGFPPDSAEDLTQEFFTQLLARDWLRRADRQRGRFRTLLLAILVRFLSDRGRKRAPKQDVFESGLVAVSTLISDSERSFDPPTTETPESIFMKQWAKTVIDNAMRQLKSWCESENHQVWYAIFRQVHFPTVGQGKPTQARLSAEFQLSRDQVRYALDETARRFGIILRKDIADQVESEEEVEKEIAELMTLLR